MDLTIDHKVEDGLVIEMLHWDYSEKHLKAVNTSIIRGQPSRITTDLNGAKPHPPSAPPPLFLEVTNIPPPRVSQCRNWEVSILAFGVCEPDNEQEELQT